MYISSSSWTYCLIPAVQCGEHHAQLSYSVTSPVFHFKSVYLFNSHVSLNVRSAALAVKTVL